MDSVTDFRQLNPLDLVGTIESEGKTSQRVRVRQGARVTIGQLAGDVQITKATMDYQLSPVGPFELDDKHWADTRALLFPTS